MAWRIEYASSALIQLKRLDKAIARRIVQYLDNRVAPLANPRSVGKALTGPLGNLWRYRVGDYRVICDLQDDVLCVLAVRIGHRSDVYR